jgi:iron complex outermembrane receptor protein
MMISSRRAGALASLMLASTAVANTNGADADSFTEVVVTGTRSEGRTAATSSVPIAVYDSDDLQASGFTDLGRVLDSISPAINMSHSQTSPSAANTRSITMKGMSPDQVLVLINGKRWQTSAVLVFNNAVGRGSAPYDLGAIPLSAVQRIEVLSDSAAAQYGSDAIAGVVNVILKSSTAGGSYTAQTGITDKGDGFNYDFSGSQGLRIGGGGHLTLSGDVRHQDATNRATADPRNGDHIDQQVGDPRALDFGVAADAGIPLTTSSDLFGSLLVSRRDSLSAPTFRLPGASVLYPEGYLPQVNPKIWNLTALAGLHTELGAGIRADLSNSYGYNSARFDVRDTANNTLGAASPTEFYSGTERYAQDTVNLTLRRGWADPLPGNIAAGLEYRHESYEISPGEPLSYEQGGAQGFPGFAPRIPVDNSRGDGSAFLDLEAQPFQRLTLGAAGRLDHYSDFGSAVTWKATARAEATRWLAIRGSIGTGFRAPSLQQEYFSSVVSQINATGALVRTGTYQIRDPIAQALGATGLTPEKSRNYSAGIVLHPLDTLLFTADWYEINVGNRIVLSDQLSGRAVSAVLIANGITDVQQVQFFTNAAHTRTDGYEISTSYSTSLGGDTSVAANVRYGQYHTTLLQLASNPVLPSLPLLGTISKGLLISAQPANKLTSSATLSHHALALTVNVDRFGPWVSAPLGALQSFGGKTLFDLIGRIDLTRKVSIRAGALNFTNVYPDLVKGASAIGLTYGDEAPFGVNGRSYFVALEVVN